MPGGRNLMLVYDDTWEGFLTAVFYAYAEGGAARSTARIAIASCTRCQPCWEQELREIATDDALADRVVKGIQRTMGQAGYEQVWTGFLSGDSRKEEILFPFIRLGMKEGRRVHQLITDDRVIAMNKLSGLVGREAHMLIQFTRFSCMEGGVYYAAVTPEHRCLPLIMPHFAERFNIQPFILHDKTHNVAGVFDRKEWVIASAEGLTLPDSSADQRSWERMWKAFYDTITIRERENPRCRMNHMPKKYWKNLVEMTLPPTPDDIALPTRPLTSPLPTRENAAIGAVQPRQAAHRRAHLPAGNGLPDIDASPPISEEDGQHEPHVQSLKQR